MSLRERIKAAIGAFRNTTLSEPEEWLLTTLGGSSSKAGIIVNQETALKVTAAYACVNVISSTIACLPIGIYQTNADGGREKDKKDPLHDILNNAWNPYLTAFRGWRIAMVNALLTEAGYIEIVRQNGRPIALYPMPSVYVSKEIDKKTLKPQYRINIDGTERVLSYADVIEIPGLASTGFTAYSPVQLLKEAAGLSIAAEEYSSEYFATGIHPNGVITYPGALKKGSDETFKNEVRSTYTGLGATKQRLMLLEEGMKFEKIANPPNEGQMIESRKFQVVEIARFFNVPPSKIMDFDRATWNNVEEMSIQFASDTITPWVRNIEQALNLQMVFPGERKNGRYIEFDMNGMLRGKLSDKMDAYYKSITCGLLSPNEARAKDNLPSYPGGDTHYRPANCEPIEKGGTQ